MKEMGDSLTAGEQLALRSELGQLMRFARIAGLCALYDASAAARNFAGVHRALGNPRAFEETTAARITRSVRNISRLYGELEFVRINGIDEFPRRDSRDSGEVKSPQKE